GRLDVHELRVHLHEVFVGHAQRRRVLTQAVDEGVRLTDETVEHLETFGRLHVDPDALLALEDLRGAHLGLTRVERTPWVALRPFDLDHARAERRGEAETERHREVVRELEDRHTRERRLPRDGAVRRRWSHARSDRLRARPQWFAAES